MSQFFKALEQAERDRLRQDQADAVPAPAEPRPAARDKAEFVEPAAAEPVAPKAKAVEVVETKAAAVEPVAAPPEPKRDRSAEKVSQPAPSPLRGHAPSSVFRSGLAARERSRVVGRGATRPSVLIAQTDPDSIEADAYRTVRTNIELMSDNGAYRNIAITSASGGDGKSTTAANLAVVAAQAGRRVCLVDADLRRPTLHDVFGLSNVDGLASALQYGRPLHEVARPADIENLSVVVAGRGEEASFHDLLTSQRLQAVLAGSETAFDLVIFDSPPVMVADALGVAAVCDGVILVVRAGSVPFAVLRRAIGQVTRVKGRVLGVLLNQADLWAGDVDSYQYDRSYHAGRSKR
jgi:protein-tyrosine kinase